MTFADLALAGTLLLAALLSLQGTAPAAAQEVVQDEGAFYRAFHEASQAGDTARAIDAAKAYLEKYPSGNTPTSSRSGRTRRA